MVSTKRLDELLKKGNLNVIHPYSWCPNCSCLRKANQGLCPHCHKKLTEAEERIIVKYANGDSFSVPISCYM